MRSTNQIEYQQVVQLFIMCAMDLSLLEDFESNTGHH